MIADYVNGAFELVGAIAIFANVRAVLRDKDVAGVSWPACLLFTIWGFWNLYYYPSLGQWASFWGGVAIAIGNAVYVALLFKYRRVR